jgi:hypothetical protein
MVKSELVAHGEVMTMILVSNLGGVAITMVARSANVGMRVLIDFTCILLDSYILLG